MRDSCLVDEEHWDECNGKSWNCPPSDSLLSSRKNEGKKCHGHWQISTLFFALKNDTGVGRTWFSPTNLINFLVSRGITKKKKKFAASQWKIHRSLVEWNCQSPEPMSLQYSWTILCGEFRWLSMKFSWDRSIIEPIVTIEPHCSFCLDRTRDWVE